MDFPKYDGNIHPDEWINNVQKYFKLRKIDDKDHLESAILLVDSTISLPAKIKNFEELGNALKEDISFTLYKNKNKRMLQSLRYIPEREGGETLKFISDFRKLCYNAEINDTEQKNYFYQSLPNSDLLFELFKRKEKVNSMNDLFRKFDEIVTDESNEKANLIRNGSIVALKHVVTGKYLTSIENIHYTTGSESQLVYAGSPEPELNSLWKITFNDELATYADTSINLQHIKTSKFLAVQCQFLGIYYKSPITKHTEVGCNNNSIYWKLDHSKLRNHKGYLKSNDTINLSIKKSYGNYRDEFLRSHDIQFTIGNNTFQEVVCHDERLGGNDEWCIELLNKVNK